MKSFTITCGIDDLQVVHRVNSPKCVCVDEKSETNFILTCGQYHIKIIYYRIKVLVSISHLGFKLVCVCASLRVLLNSYYSLATHFSERQFHRL